MKFINTLLPVIVHSTYLVLVNGDNAPKPTRLPTIIPTSIPTMIPTIKSTITPTMQPSRYPTANPVTNSPTTYSCSSIYDFTGPNIDWGLCHNFQLSSGSSYIEACGYYIDGTPTKLYGKNGGGYENGLGVVDDPDYEINKRTFVQLDMRNSNALNTIQVMIGSLALKPSSTELFTIYGTTVRGSSGGTVLIQDSILQGVFVQLPGYSIAAYPYLNIQVGAASTFSSPNILLMQISMESSCAPTFSPTFAPTQLPTLSPTFTPSNTPTLSPTLSPTRSPTIVPTKAPTSSPTISKSPTITPTKVPTNSPTLVPTLSPTQSPTVSPTLVPSLLPTSVPTIVPTLTPTIIPSISPTMSPSDSPTQMPTQTPTDAPSLTPTLVPTIVPSLSPTYTPTTTAPSQSPTQEPTRAPAITQYPTQPTFTPTYKPSIVPSIAPTASPTIMPTDSPSLTPTSAPSDQPTMSPTEVPTNMPTLQPTFVPSALPSIEPTLIPTDAPTISPSMTPTEVPSSMPTATYVPSATPTIAPTSQPTLSPTTVPSFVPTLIPTIVPSLIPTTYPTIQPSTMPTNGWSQCSFVNHTTTSNTLKAYFIVHHVIENIVPNDFHSTLLNNSATKAIQCAMDSNYTIVPLIINYLDFISISVRRMRNGRNLNVVQTQIQYTVAYDFPVLANINPPAAYVEMYTYFNNITSLMTTHVLNGVFDANIVGYCGLLGGCPSSVWTSTSNIQYFGPYLLTDPTPVSPPTTVLSKAHGSSNSPLMDNNLILIVSILITMLFILLILGAAYYYYYKRKLEREREMEKWQLEGTNADIEVNKDRSKNKTYNAFRLSLSRLSMRGKKSEKKMEEDVMGSEKEMEMNMERAFDENYVAKNAMHRHESENPMSSRHS